MPRLDRTRENETGGVHEALLRAVAVTGLVNGESVLPDPDREAVEVRQADLVQSAVAQLTHRPVNVMSVGVQRPAYEQRPRLTGEIGQQRHWRVGHRRRDPLEILPARFELGGHRPQCGLGLRRHLAVTSMPTRSARTNRTRSLTPDRGTVWS